MPVAIDTPRAPSRSAPLREPCSAPTPAAAWREFGRAERGDALWITWIAVLGGRGDALYRSLVVADGAIAVSVELLPCRGGGSRAVHRGRCTLPALDDAQSIEGRAASLLAAADEALARTGLMEWRAPPDGRQAAM